MQGDFFAVEPTILGRSYRSPKKQGAEKGIHNLTGKPCFPCNVAL